MHDVTTDQLVRRAADGERFSFARDGRPLGDLLSVAAAARRARGEVELTGLDDAPIEDLIRIAVTGGDNVIFGREAPARLAAAPKRRSRFFG